MKLIKEYLCNGHPSDDEIIESLEILAKEDCIIKLTWFIRYNGWHKIFIKKDMTLEECKDRLPKRYGL